MPSLSSRCLGLAVLAAVAAGVAAQTIQVQNVRAEQLTDGSKIVRITYDLVSPNAPKVYVYFTVSSDAGQSYRIFPRTYDGAAGADVTPGQNKVIRWFAGTDMPGVVGTEFRVAVTAWEGNNPSELIYIPPGEFLMGNSGFGNDGSYSGNEERPQHRVDMPGYWIGRNEVTRAEYRRFVNAGGYRNSAYWSAEGWAWRSSNRIVEPSDWSEAVFYGQTELHPVIGVSYYEAEAYCNWAGHRLPTEAEWEKAARWDGSPRVYPWGNVWYTDRCNWASDTIDTAGTSVVGSYPMGASPYGCMDMAGNAWEWCKDWFSSTYYQQEPPGGWVNPQGPASGPNRVLRGGAWSSGYYNLRAAYRYNGNPNYRFNFIGFRVARSGS